MTAGRDQGVVMIAGAQGDDPLFPRAASAASPLLRITAAAAAAAQWRRGGTTATETAVQGMMPAAALLLLSVGRMLALPPTAAVPAPEMEITTIMLVAIIGGVSLLTIKRGMPQLVRN